METVDWVVLPTTCGQFVLSDWLTTRDVLALDSACTSHRSRDTFLQWCKHLLLNKFDIPSDNVVFNDALQWLMIRFIHLKHLDFGLDVEVSFPIATSYLRKFGATLTSLDLEFYLWDEINGLYDQIAVPTTSLLAQLHVWCPGLRKMKILYCLNDAGMAALIPTLSKLDNLRICCCKDITALGFSMVGQFCRLLSSLSISGVRVPAEALVLMGDGCMNLTMLHLGLSNYAEEGMMNAIATMLRGLTKLTDLELRHMNHSIAVAIADSLPALCSLQIGGATTASDAELGVLFQRCTKLEHFRLGSCPQLTDMGLSHFRNLSSLKMGDVDRVTDASGAVLGRNNPNLYNLSVEEARGISERFVLDFLRNCPHIQCVNVYKSVEDARRPLTAMDRLAHTTLRQLFPQLTSISVKL